jgi:hypothetical protein
MQQSIINEKYLLEKMSGKGGWTYVVLPNVLPDKKQPFGWLQVSGRIDDFPLKQYKLMPMAKGTLFLPVKAEIRKKIRKKEGDWVHIELYHDDSPLEIPDEIMVCLLDAPKAHQFFESISYSSQKHYIDWVLEAKALETKVNRIAIMIEKLEKGLKLYEKIEKEEI